MRCSPIFYDCDARLPRESSMNWPFGSLRPFSYDLIMADPPWSFDNWSKAGEAKNAKAQYECEGLDWIKSLPVGDLASPNSVLWLWATNPLLPEAIEVLRAWGFQFKTAGHWAKTTKHGKRAFGTGYILRCAGEPFLIGTIGKPKTTRAVRSVIDGVIREHSRKPDEAFEAAVQLLPGARRLELFSRQSREGWDTWGNESTKFDEEAA